MMCSSGWSTRIYGTKAALSTESYPRHGNRHSRKETMNKFFRAALSATLLLGFQDAHAAYLVNDLILGFDRDNGSGGGPSDYVINLGNFQSAVGVGGSSVVDLSGLFSVSTFNSLYGSLSSGVTMSVVGGNGAASGRSLFASVLRGGSAPEAIPAGFMASGANDVG